MVALEGQKVIKLLYFLNEFLTSTQAGQEPQGEGLGRWTKAAPSLMYKGTAVRDREMGKRWRDGGRGVPLYAHTHTHTCTKGEAERERER